MVRALMALVLIVWAVSEASACNGVAVIQGGGCCVQQQAFVVQPHFVQSFAVQPHVAVAAVAVAPAQRVRVNQRIRRNGASVLRIRTR